MTDINHEIINDEIKSYSELLQGLSNDEIVALPSMNSLAISALILIRDLIDTGKVAASPYERKQINEICNSIHYNWKSMTEV